MAMTMTMTMTMTTTTTNHVFNSVLNPWKIATVVGAELSGEHWLSTKFCLTDFAAPLYIFFVSTNFALFFCHCLLLKLWKWDEWREALRKGVADERLEQGWIDGLLNGIYRSWWATRGPDSSPVKRKDDKTRKDDVIENMREGDEEQNIEEASDVNSKNYNNDHNDEINGNKDITVKDNDNDKGEDGNNDNDNDGNDNIVNINGNDKDDVGKNSITENDNDIDGQRHSMALKGSCSESMSKRRQRISIHTSVCLYWKYPHYPKIQQNRNLQSFSSSSETVTAPFGANQTLTTTTTTTR